MPHLHLSLQSGDDLVLKRMKRRHSRAEAVAFCAQMRDLRPVMNGVSWMPVTQQTMQVLPALTVAFRSHLDRRVRKVA